MNILIIENQLLIAKDLKETILSLGYSNVSISITLEDSIQELETKHIDLIIVGNEDFFDTTSYEAVEYNSERFDIPVIYLLSYENKNKLKELKFKECFRYIITPVDPENLETTIEREFYYHKLKAKLRQTNQFIDNLNATSDKVSFLNGLITNNINSAFLVTNSTGKFITYNQVFLDMFGLSNNDMDKFNTLSYLPFVETSVSGDISFVSSSKEKVENKFSYLINSEKTFLKYKIIPLKNSFYDNSSMVCFFDFDEEEKFKYLKMENKLKHQEILEIIPYSALIVDNETIVFANNNFLRLVGFESKDEVEGKNITNFILIKDSDEKKDEFFESNLVKVDNKIIPVSIFQKFININGVNSKQIFISDLTKQKTELEYLNQSLQDVIQKTNYKLRSNLQILSSIFNLQLRTLKGSDIYTVLLSNQNRLKTVSYIFDKPILAEIVDTDNIRDYFTKIINNLFRTYKLSTNQIKSKFVIENVSLHINNLLPFGLIINELISNAMVHAFPDKKGEILISFLSDSEKIELCISDSGIGMPEGSDIMKPSSVGLKLVNELVIQVGFTLSFVGETGTSFKIYKKLS